MNRSRVIPSEARHRGQSAVLNSDHLHAAWRALLLAATMTAATAAVVTAARADDVRWRPGSSNYDWNVDGRLVDVSVLVGGSETPLYHKAGAWDRSYFQAFKGRNYALQLRNNTGERVGVLIAVDGLNVVNGERSSLSNREAMYVLDPFESATIRGWRTSLDEVRRFVFVDEERSYAERTGQANGDMGWIRVLAFREQRPIAWTLPRFNGGPEPYDKDGMARERGDASGEARDEARREVAPAPQAPGKSGVMPYNSQPQTEQSAPGTGWGERRQDRVEQTRFLAAAGATDRITLRYEYSSGLRALGIVPVRERNRDRVWERERGELGFAQPPRW